jgi:hypothetical protein
VEIRKAEGCIVGAVLVVAVLRPPLYCELITEIKSRPSHFIHSTPEIGVRATKTAFSHADSYISVVVMTLVVVSISVIVTLVASWLLVVQSFGSASQ